MQIHRFLILLAALLFSATTLTACEDDDHHDDEHHHHDDHDALEHACSHLSGTPTILTAAANLDGEVESFSSLHTPILVMQDESTVNEDDDAPVIGYIAFEVTSHSDIKFYSEAGAPWTLLTSDGDPVQFGDTDTDVEPLCEVTRVDEAHLHPGTYHFRFEFSDQWNSASFILFGDDDHHHDDHDDHDH